jgi:dihydrofolate synthase/folylpolyglutamate synthase
MNYDNTLKFLYQQLPMYQRIGKKAFKKSLDNIRTLCALLDNPQERISCIHIAGTNGKGSVAHILSSIGQTAGLKTGLYTSPHLLDFRERIRVNNLMIPESEVISFVEIIQKEIVDIQPSFFEITVAMAFKYFRDSNVDIAVIETGLGGRLDSTNIITTPLISCITNIGFDHTDMLGDTISQIAKEKAGIIKDGVECVIGEFHPDSWPVFIEKALECSSDISCAEDLYKVKCKNKLNSGQEIELFDLIENINLNFKTDLSGSFQLKNIRTAKVVFDVWKKKDRRLSENHFTNALASIKKISGLSGRWQVVKKKPNIIIDCGHNSDGIKASIEDINCPGTLNIVYGCVNDKNVQEMLKVLPITAQYFLCKPNVIRGKDVTDLGLDFKNAGFDSFKEFKDVKTAIEEAINILNETDMLLIFGSIFVVSEAISYFENILDE